MFVTLFQFKQDGKDLDRMVKYGQEYPYAFPLWFGPFVSFLNIHHPEYVKTILASTGAWQIRFQSFVWPLMFKSPVRNAYNKSLFPAEPKDDLAYSFIQDWIGKTIFQVSYTEYFAPCGMGLHSSFSLHSVCLSLQGMVYWCQMVRSGFGTDDSWRRASIMMFWNLI